MAAESAAVRRLPQIAAPPDADIHQQVLDRAQSSASGSSVRPTAGATTSVDTPGLPSQREQLATSSKPTGRLRTALLATFTFPLAARNSRWASKSARSATAVSDAAAVLQGDIGSSRPLSPPGSTAGQSGQLSGGADGINREILAEQHCTWKLAAWPEPLGIRVGWHPATLKRKNQTGSGAAVAGSNPAVRISTHAVSRRGIRPARLAIVDEQHRFGNTSAGAAQPGQQSRTS